MRVNPIYRQDILKVGVAFLGYAVGWEPLMEEHQSCAAQLREVIIKELKGLHSAKLIRALIQAKCLNLEQQQLVIRRYVEQLR